MKNENNNIYLLFAPRIDIKFFNLPFIQYTEPNLPSNSEELPKYRAIFKDPVIYLIFQLNYFSLFDKRDIKQHNISIFKILRKLYDKENNYIINEVFIEKFISEYNILLDLKLGLLQENDKTLISSSSERIFNKKEKAIIDSCIFLFIFTFYSCLYEEQDFFFNLYEKKKLLLSKEKIEIDHMYDLFLRFTPILYEQNPSEICYALRKKIYSLENTIKTISDINHFLIFGYGNNEKYHFINEYQSIIKDILTRILNCFPNINNQYKQERNLKYMIKKISRLNEHEQKDYLTEKLAKENIYLSTKFIKHCDFFLKKIDITAITFKGLIEICSTYEEIKDLLHFKILSDLILSKTAKDFAQKINILNDIFDRKENKESLLYMIDILYSKIDFCKDNFFNRSQYNQYIEETINEVSSHEQKIILIKALEILGENIE